MRSILIVVVVVLVGACDDPGEGAVERTECERAYDTLCERAFACPETSEIILGNVTLTSAAECIAHLSDGEPGADFSGRPIGCFYDVGAIDECQQAADDVACNGRFLNGDAYVAAALACSQEPSD
jgi:hypothetical protein